MTTLDEVRERAEDLAAQDREWLIARVEELAELLEEARDDVATVANVQTKRHRISSYKEQLRQIDAALARLELEGVPQKGLD